MKYREQTSENNTVDEAVRFRRLIFKINAVPILLVILLIACIILGLYVDNSRRAAKEQLENSMKQEAVYLEKELGFCVNLTRLIASYIEELYVSLKPEEVPDRAQEEMERLFRRLPEAAKVLSDITFLSQEDAEKSFWMKLEQGELCFRNGKVEDIESENYMLLVPVYYQESQVGLVAAFLSDSSAAVPNMKESEFETFKKNIETSFLFNEMTGEIVNSDSQGIVGKRLDPAKLSGIEKNRVKVYRAEDGTKQLVFYSDLGLECLSMISYWPSDEVFLYFLQKNFLTYFIILTGILAAVLIFLLTGRYSYQRLIHGRIKQNVTAVSLLETMMKSDNIALIYLDSELQIQNATPSIVEELCGMSLEQAIGRKLTEFSGVGKLASFLLNYAQGNRKENGLIFSAYHHVRKYKNWLYVEIKTIAGVNEKTDYLLMFLRSTDNILGAQTLNSILEVTQNGILVVNEAGEITKISKKLAELLNLDITSGDEKLFISGLTQMTLNGSYLKDLFQLAEKQGNYSGTMYLEYNKVPAEACWVQVEISSLRVGEEPVGMLFVMTDITEYLNKEAEAYKAVHLKEDLLRTVSHGIRTPLNVIVGTSDLLALEGELTEPQIAEVERIRVACSSLIEIMNEIVDYTGMNTDRETEAGKEFMFREVLTEVMNSVNMIAIKKNLDLYLDIDPRISGRQFGAVRSIKFILYNLLNCAIDAVNQGYLKLWIRSHSDVTCPELDFILELFDSSEEIFSNFENGGSEANRFLMEFKYVLAREGIHKLGKEIRMECKSGHSMELRFEIPVEFLDGMSCAKVEEPKQERVLLLTERPEFAEVLKNALEQLGVSYLEDLTKQPSEETVTAILLDYRYSSASAWLNRQLTEGQRLILLAYSREIPGSEMEADRQVLYQPICSFKIADSINQKIIPRQEQLRQKLFATTGARVLVVDDNEVNLLVAQNMLSFFQLEAVTADSAAKALELLIKEDFDIVFMDHLMPEIDGVEATKRIRSLAYPKNQTVVIALSANLVPASVALFEEAGISDVLAKPIELPLLSACLKKWLPKEKIVEEGCFKTSDEINWQEAKEGPQNRSFRLNMSSEEGSRRLLLAACRNIRENLKAAEEAAARNDLEAIRFAIHSLKGIYLNLAVERLPEEAGGLETAVKEKELRVLERELPEFLSAGKQLLEELEQALKAYDKITKDTEQEEEPEAETAPEEVLRQVRQVLYYVERFEIDYITGGLTALKKAVRGKQKELVIQAEEAAAGFDYEKVREQLRQLEEDYRTNEA